MTRKILLCFAFVVFVQALTASDAAAQCGGLGQAPCSGGPFAGCANDRLNNTWGLVCLACGGTEQPACTFGPKCDEGNRELFGFCWYSGFSKEPTTNVVVRPRLRQPEDDPVRGIADLHTHQFSNLGFGGVVFWGAPHDARGINHALPWCDYTHEFSTEWSANELPGPVFPSLGSEIHGAREWQALSHPVSSTLPEGQHAVGGTGPFEGWPTHNTYTHQQMFHTWVERAYLGGIRLMVQHMVSNEALCLASKRRSDFTCNDMDAVDKQIDATKDLERAIDRMDDGVVNKSGWYRIAYSPKQAREIIRSGKMAVVLGIEVDTLFNCKPDSNCSREYLRSELERYYAKGVRHVFPIHHFDNAYGGPAIFRDELNAGNAAVTGDHFKVRNCQPEGYTYNVNGSFLLDLLVFLLQGRPFPDQNYYNQFPADCNARGLTETGRALIEEMMDLNFIIDTDHMSRLMADEVMQMARTTTETRPNKYPLVSSHTGFLSRSHGSEFSVHDAQLAIFKEIGGMITATNPKGDCSTTADFRDDYLFAVNAMKKHAGDRFPGVGFSTDTNGFAGATGPRFGNPSCEGAAETELPYPFTGVMGGLFSKQTTGDRSFDFNQQGLAHYGLLADFFADLKRTGMTDAELGPLLNSAETYIRLWERVNNSRHTDNW